MKLIKTISILLSGLILMGCNSDSPEATPPVTPPQAEQESQELGSPYKDIQFSNSDIISAYKARDFGTQLLQKIAAEDEGNIFISPFGVHAVLSMIANGAEEESLQEILQTLNIDNLEDLNSYYAKVTSALSDADNQVRFSSVNSMWTKPSFTPLPAYTNIIKTNYLAEAFSEELHTDAARLKINNWISDKTEGMIPEFFKENLDENIVMLLINALYFNGKWKEPFDVSKTTKEDFFGTNKTSKVEMMHQKIEAEGKIYDNGIMASIPYGNTTFKLNIYLPNEGVSPEAFLSSGNFSRSFSSIRECTLSIPKIQMEGEYKNLKEQLKYLGITKIFEDINPLPFIHNDLNIAFIIQKTSFEINESGAKAAAATVAGAQLTADAPEDSTPIVINVNRPFLFTITAYDEVVLFSGLVRNL